MKLFAPRNAQLLNFHEIKFDKRRGSLGDYGINCYNVTFKRTSPFNKERSPVPCGKSNSNSPTYLRGARLKTSRTQRLRMGARLRRQPRRWKKKEKRSLLTSFAIMRRERNRNERSERSEKTDLSKLPSENGKSSRSESRPGLQWLGAAHLPSLSLSAPSPWRSPWDLTAVATKPSEDNSLRIYFQKFVSHLNGVVSVFNSHILSALSREVELVTLVCAGG